jgi:hypothetical protein
MSIVRLLNKHRALLRRVAARTMLLAALAAVAGSGPSASCAIVTTRHAALGTQGEPVAAPPGQPGPGSDWPDPQASTPGTDPGSDWPDPQGSSRPTSGACGK